MANSFGLWASELIILLFDLKLQESVFIDLPKRFGLYDY